MKKIRILLLVLSFLFCSFSAVATEAEETDYLSYVPTAAYHGYSAFTEIPQELFNFYQYGITTILFDELFRLNFIPEEYTILQRYPREEDLASSVKIPVSDMKSIIDRLYGKGSGDLAIIGQEFHHVNGELHLWPLKNEDAYAFCPAIYQSSPGFLYYSKQLDSEVVGENLIIRSVYAEWNYGEESDWEWNGSAYKVPVTIYSVENSFATSNYNILATWKENGKLSKLESRIRGGDFDEYLPVYKHTFKPNGDGTYYWAKTELETAGKKIPLSVIGESVEIVSTNTNTAGGAESDLPTSDTGTVTDLPTSDTETNLPASGTVTNLPTDSATVTSDVSDVGASEGSATWIYVTVGLAVAGAVAVGAALIFKGKKKA